ncbi:1354_t:CDS:2, partial [Acaulospora colombiana]
VFQRLDPLSPAALYVLIARLLLLMYTSYLIYSSLPTFKTECTMDPTNSSITLRCLSFSEGNRLNALHMFNVYIPSDTGTNFDVARLRAMVFAQMAPPGRTTYNANQLILWKINFKLPHANLGDVQRMLDEIHIDHKELKEVQARVTILHPFAELTPELASWADDSCIHILVQEPLRGPYAGSLANYGGTPGSGKSVLAELLINYIQNQEPDAEVMFVSGWKDQVNYFHERVEKYGWDIKNPNSVLVVDEAQDTYRDQELWTGTFKKIANEDWAHIKARVILFSSYGSESARFLNFRTTPIVLDESRRVGLWPVDNDEGLPSVGLFLSPEEFPLIASKGMRGHHFDSTFLKWVYW